ncbi:MAG TPA: class I SAM-dependent methyltransferase [Phycisphaerae bacterium]|nr:class I SAM-dependent methyltransferase [Phycisphaerae bacterium]
MQTSVLEHIRCPRTQKPLDLQVTRADGDEILDGELTAKGGNGHAPAYRIRNGIAGFVSNDVMQTQTVQSFAQKWSKHDYYRKHTGGFYTQWYLDRYGFKTPEGLQAFLNDCRFVLDAGTGMGRDSALFAAHSSATVFGVDTSREALEVARQDVQNPRVVFIQADINRLPFPDGFLDFISCDQVIHHTADPRAAFESLARKLKSGGRICCYVYKKKAVLREFADDYVRERISGLPIDEALKVCEGVTRLGQALAGLKVEVDVPEDIPVLGIRKGRCDVQRFIHWNVMKCFWNDDFDFFTNNIINFDWYHPEFCYRYEPGEFRSWFAKGWEIEAWDVQDAGISCRARKL